MTADVTNVFYNADQRDLCGFITSCHALTWVTSNIGFYAYVNNDMTADVTNVFYNADQRDLCGFITNCHALTWCNFEHWLLCIFIV